MQDKNIKRVIFIKWIPVDHLPEKELADDGIITKTKDTIDTDILLNDLDIFIYNIYKANPKEPLQQTLLKVSISLKECLSVRKLGQYTYNYFK